MDTHENYLDNIYGVKEREAALHVHSEQFKLKHEFDYFIKLDSERGSPTQGLHNKSCKERYIHKNWVIQNIVIVEKRKVSCGVVKQITKKYEIAQKM